MSKFQVGDKVVRDYKSTCDPFISYARRVGINCYGTFTVSRLSKIGYFYIEEIGYLVREDRWRLATPYSKEDCL